jgi:putative ABC transport system permease protein
VSLPAGARFVRCLARVAALTYPPRFRRLHGDAFSDVAIHRWEREARARSRMRATMATTRLLVTDTMAASTRSWLEAATDDTEDRPNLRAVLRSASRWLRDGGRDVRLAARSATRRPGIFAFVALTLGLGIGASTTAFDALDRAILHPLPFAGSDRLVFLSMQDRLRGFRSTPPLSLVERWRAGARSIERIEIFEEQSVTRLRSSGADLLAVLAISSGLPDMLGVRPVTGRLLGAQDAAAGAAGVVMLSEQFWRREFGADPAVVGQPLMLASGPVTIAGIWPAGARLNPRRPPDVVRMLPAGREIVAGNLSYLVARLAPGASSDGAVRELASLSVGAADVFDTATPAIDSQAFIFLGPAYVTGVWLVFAGALALLIVAIANVVAVLVELSARRSHELGLRLALGGSGARLARLFVAEGIIFVGAGLMAAMVIATGLEAAIVSYEPRLFSDVSGAGLAGRALGFACAAGVLVALVCAVAPLWRLRTTDIRHVLAQSSGARATAAPWRAQYGLVAAQAALAVLLVSGAGLMARSFSNLARVDVGFDIDRLAELSLLPPAARYPTPEAQAAFATRVAESIRALPGVTGLVPSGMPILSASVQMGLPRLEGEPVPQDAGATTLITSAAPGYFDVMGITLVAGRLFTPADRDVAIVNEAFARRRVGPVVGQSLYTPRSQRSFTIVGVVNNTRTFGFTEHDDLINVYFPDTSALTGFVRFIVRTNGEPEDVLRQARVRIAALDPHVPIRSATTGPDVLRRRTSQHRFVAVLLAGVAALGFLLALGGVYGAVALRVSTRTREMGVRLALGATPAALVRALIGSGLRPVWLGGAVGAVAAWLVAPQMEPLLFRVSPHDPVSATGAVAIVVTMAAAAALIPARRVTRVDPAITLRST